MSTVESTSSDPHLMQAVLLLQSLQINSAAVMVTVRCTSSNCQKYLKNVTSSRLSCSCSALRTDSVASDDMCQIDSSSTPLHQGFSARLVKVLEATVDFTSKTPFTSLRLSCSSSALSKYPIVSEGKCQLMAIVKPTPRQSCLTSSKLSRSSELYN